MGKILTFGLILISVGQAWAGDNDGDAPTPAGLGPYTAQVTGYSATDPSRKNKEGRNAKGQCPGGLEGPNTSPGGQKPLDMTFDKGGGDVMVAVNGTSQFKNCHLNIPGLGSRFVVLDYKPGGSGISEIDISHWDCKKMSDFGKRMISGIYVLKGPGCNADQAAQQPAKRRNRGGGG